ncbi:MAG: hypothetical protein ABIN01_10250 [Ferruginibacter sp.]
MERKKETIILTIIVFLTGICSAQKNDIATYDSTGLIEEFKPSKFVVYKTVKNIDTSYTSFRKLYDESYCIANPHQKFNETDLRKAHYCNHRLTLYGSSVTDNNIKVILYEEDHGGGPGKTCAIYKVKNGKVISLVSFFLNPKTKTISEIKFAINHKKYTIVETAP